MWKLLLLLTLLCGGVSSYQIPHDVYAQEYTIAQDFRFGYCPITGDQIITEEGRILPNYRLVWFELDNGSRMPLPVSVQAVNAITESDFERIMAWVRAGWLYEINRKKWTPEQIQSYRDTYFNLKIVRMEK